jgi:hypothetical protein
MVKIVFSMTEDDDVQWSGGNAEKAQKRAFYAISELRY